MLTVSVGTNSARQPGSGDGGLLLLVVRVVELQFRGYGRRISHEDLVDDGRLLVVVLVVVVLVVVVLRILRMLMDAVGRPPERGRDVLLERRLERVEVVGRRSGLDGLPTDRDVGFHDPGDGERQRIRRLRAVFLAETVHVGPAVADRGHGLHGGHA